MRARRRQQKLAAMGHTSSTPAEPVRAYLAALELPVSHIAQVSGVPTATVSDVMRGARKQVKRATAARLLTVKRAPLPVTGCVPSAGSVRRLRALVAVGWPEKAIADETGMSRQFVNQLVKAAHPTTEAGTARRIAKAYASMWQGPPTIGVPERRATARARRHGWVPPLAWDDGTGPHGIDNPDATPLSWRPEDAPPSRGRPGFDLDDLAFLADCGLTLDEAADRLGVTRDAIEYRCWRGGHDDVIGRLRRAGKAS